MKVFHLVCPNGLGHFKRTTEIWSHILTDLHVELVIACEEWQLNKSRYTKAVTAIIKSPNVRFLCVNMSGALRWSDDPNYYSIEQYHAFNARIAEESDFRAADLVISDNLVGVLDKHANVLLIGSFLWHDVLEYSYQQQAPLEIINYEKVLLNKYLPKSISIGEITMPAVVSCTRNTQVDWLCENVFSRTVPYTNKKWNVLFSAGLSGAQSAHLYRIFQMFLEDKRFSVVATPGFKEKFSVGLNKEIRDFDFSPEAFHNIDLRIARPGVGTIVESIKYQTPIVAVDDAKNTEMIYNAEQVVRLGIGWNALRDKEIEIEDIIEEYPNRLANLKARPVNGFAQIREIINSYVKN